MKEKLVAQTYDGSAVMSGNARGVQTLLKETYPNAQFVHCYAHQQNLTLHQLCAGRVSVLTKCFFADLSYFFTFFSLTPKRLSTLAESANRWVPRPPDTQWNFKSRTVNVVWEDREALVPWLE